MISKYSEKITIQKSVSVMDRYGNWKDEWTDVYVCHAHVNSLYGSEYYAAAELQKEESLDFTTRFCIGMLNICPETYRIIFRGRVYNIDHIDYLSFKKRELKIRAKLEDANGKGKD